MRIDLYTRTVLTVIAAALVYLCALQTPWPVASAQTAQRPGMPTGPAEVVVIGWRTPPNDRVPVQVVDSIPMKVTGDVRVTGSVETRQQPNTLARVSLVGWEERGDALAPGAFRRFNLSAKPNEIQGLPVTTR